MALFQVFRETTLPQQLQPYAMYLIAPADKPELLEIYATGATTDIIRRVIDSSLVDSKIDAAIAGLAQVEIVADITERNALTPTSNQFVLVLDATGDLTVASGAANYVYRASDETWIKISEAESMDFVLDWNNLVNKPTSSALEIDNAVALRHSHANKTELDKIGEDASGHLTYNGALPVIAWDSVTW